MCVECASLFSALIHFGVELQRVTSFYTLKKKTPCLMMTDDAVRRSEKKAVLFFVFVILVLVVSKVGGQFGEIP